MIVEVGVGICAGEGNADVEIVIEPLEAVRLPDGWSRRIDRRSVDPFGDGGVRSGEPFDTVRREERALKELDRVVVARDRRWCGPGCAREAG
jgi:hypothetical protein